MTPNSEPRRSDASVGVFWLLAVAGAPDGNSWLAHRCPPDGVETYGDCLTCPHGHYQLWEAWRSGTETDAAIGLSLALRHAVEASEYDDWPRGRVVREPDRSVVYADRQLLTPPRRAAIVSLFALDPETTPFRPDAHYSRARTVR